MQVGGWKGEMALYMLADALRAHSGVVAADATAAADGGTFAVHTYTRTHPPLPSLSHDYPFLPACEFDYTVINIMCPLCFCLRCSVCLSACLLQV